MSNVVVFSGSEDWSAVYLDGKLARVGDHYLIDEWLREHFEVATESSDDFMRGGDHYEDVAQTLEDIKIYYDARTEKVGEAQVLLDQAQALQEQAKALLEAPVKGETNG